MLESHQKYMKDIGKRSIVIQRINRDLDCVDIRDHRYPSPINNSKKLVELYKDLSTLQSENEMQS